MSRQDQPSREACPQDTATFCDACLSVLEMLTQGISPQSCANLYMSKTTPVTMQNSLSHVKFIIASTVKDARDCRCHKMLQNIAKGVPVPHRDRINYCDQPHGGSKIGND